MRLHQANTFEEIEVTVADKSQRRPTAACGAEPGRSLKSSREEVLALLKPDGDRTRTICAVAGALIVGFVLGWRTR